MRTNSQPWYVIGHRNPDADAIFSAIGHAAYLRATGHANVLAARCGELQERTRVVLERAGLAQPKLLTDVRPTAGSISRKDAVVVSDADTFMEAYRLMVDRGVRSVPVLTAGGEVVGILRYLDLLQLLLPQATEGVEARTIHASLENISKTIGATHEGGSGDGAEEDHILMVGASSQNTVERRLRTAREEGTVSRYVVICGDRPVVHQHALEFGARALIVTGGYPTSDELTAEARKRGMTIIRSPHDTAMTVKLALCARRVSHVLEDGFQLVEESQTVSQVSRQLMRLRQDLFPVVRDGTREMVGVFSKSDLVDPPRTRLSLVDHNEFSQAVMGVEEAEVVEIIDHHRLSGDLVSREPLRFLNEPLGSTSTIVARRFRESGKEPDAATALCLCAGLISDTLNLTSPTTTDVDRELRDWLAGIAGVNGDEFAAEFFAAGSLLVHGTPEQIIGSDRKEFTEQGDQISLSQIEELSLDVFPQRREALEVALREVLERGGFALAALLVTDIKSHHSLLLAVGDEKVLEALEFRRCDATLYEAPGIVSRKKQLFPAVCRGLAKARM